jgi:hypothetical protein
VLEAGEGRLRLVADGGDTVAYELTVDSQLVRNETPVHIGVPGGRVGTFEAARAGEALQESSAREMLLEVTLTLVGPDLDSSRVRLQANARAAEDMVQGGWNF